MSQSLETRLGDDKELIEYRNTWGDFKTMEKYGIRDYVAFKRFLGKRGEAAHQVPVLGDNTNWAEDLLAAFENRLDKLKAENECLKEMLHESELRIEYLQCQEASKIEPRVRELLSLCKE